MPKLRMTQQQLLLLRRMQLTQLFYEMTVDVTAEKFIVASGRVVQLAVEENMVKSQLLSKKSCEMVLPPALKHITLLFCIAIKLHTDSHHAVPSRTRCLLGHATLLSR